MTDLKIEQRHIDMSQPLPIDVGREYRDFTSWWKTWCPDKKTPAVSSHIFDAWLARARTLAASPPPQEGIEDRARALLESHFDGSNSLMALALRDPSYPKGWATDDDLQRVLRAITKALRGADSVAGGEVEAERDEARQVISWANNSLYGSHGFFLSVNGGPADPHHLDRKIEELKAYGRQQYARALAAEARLAQMRAALKCVLDTSGARGTYHALKYVDAVEAAEALLTDVQDKGRA